MTRASTLVIAWALALGVITGCAGERHERARPREPQEVRADETTPSRSAVASDETEEGDVAIGARPGAEEDSDPFSAPFPEEPCAQTRVAVRAEGSDYVLGEAMAFSSEDGRHIRVAIATSSLARDDRGRFVAPSRGHARFEFDGTRRRRGRLSPRVLGAPDSSRGGLTHARILTEEATVTFGHRGVGTVELTEITEARICGRVDLDDGFGRVRGPFRAEIDGPLPE